MWDVAGLALLILILVVIHGCMIGLALWLKWSLAPRSPKRPRKADECD